MEDRLSAPRPIRARMKRPALWFCGREHRAALITACPTPQARALGAPPIPWVPGNLAYAGPPRSPPIAYAAHNLLRYLGSYVIEEDAARAVDAACAERGLPQQNADVLCGIRAPAHKSPSSLFSGVCWDTAASKWKAQMRIAGKTLNIGHYTDERAAARAADAAWAERGLPRRNARLLDAVR